MTPSELQHLRELCERATRQLASVYEHRRNHTPTTQWHNRMRELDNYFIDEADKALSAVPALIEEVERLRAANERMATVILQFRNTVSDARRALERRGQGGQQVSFHGDFCNAMPSVMERLCWWARELEVSTFEEDPK